VFETGEEESDCWLIFIDIIVSLRARPFIYSQHAIKIICSKIENIDIKKNEEEEENEPIMFLLNIIHALG
jgi:hypothetical protein